MMVQRHDLMDAGHDSINSSVADHGDSDRVRCRGQPMRHRVAGKAGRRLSNKDLEFPALCSSFQKLLHRYIVLVRQNDLTA